MQADRRLRSSGRGFLGVCRPEVDGSRLDCSGGQYRLSRRCVAHEEAGAKVRKGLSVCQEGKEEIRAERFTYRYGMTFG